MSMTLQKTSSEFRGWNINVDHFLLNFRNNIWNTSLLFHPAVKYWFLMWFFFRNMDSFHWEIEEYFREVKYSPIYPSQSSSKLSLQIQWTNKELMIQSCVWVFIPTPFRVNYTHTYTPPPPNCYLTFPSRYIPWIKVLRNHHGFHCVEKRLQEEALNCSFNSSSW